MNTPSSPDREKTRHFISLLKRFPTAMLVTCTPERGIHARPMAIAEVEDDGRLWFLTCADTAKVHEIEVDSHVHIVAQEGQNAFLSLSGRASLIADREKIAQLWQEPFREWFPKGKDDPELELISVHPECGEFWDNTGAKRFKYLWEALARGHSAGAMITAESAETHGEVQL